MEEGRLARTASTCNCKIDGQVKNLRVNFSQLLFKQHSLTRTLSVVCKLSCRSMLCGDWAFSFSMRSFLLESFILVFSILLLMWLLYGLTSGRVYYLFFLHLSHFMSPFWTYHRHFAKECTYAQKVLISLVSYIL